MEKELGVLDRWGDRGPGPLSQLSTQCQAGQGPGRAGWKWVTEWEGPSYWCHGDPGPGPALSTPAPTEGSFPRTRKPRHRDEEHAPGRRRGPDVAPHEPRGQVGPGGWFLGRHSPWPLLALPATLRDAHSPTAAWHPTPRSRLAGTPASVWASPSVHAPLRLLMSRPASCFSQRADRALAGPGRSAPQRPLKPQPLGAPSLEALKGLVSLA